MPGSKLYGVFTLILYGDRISKGKMHLVVLEESAFKTRANRNFNAFGNLSNHPLLRSILIPLPVDNDSIAKL